MGLKQAIPGGNAIHHLLGSRARDPNIKGWGQWARAFGTLMENRLIECATRGRGVDKVKMSTGCHDGGMTVVSDCCLGG